MPTSVKAFFDQKVPAALATNPEKAKDVAAIYLFKVSGPDGGTWTVDLVSTPPTAKVGEVGTPQCTVEATDDDFRTMIDGGMQVAMSLFFSGKLKVAGPAPRALVTDVLSGARIAAGSTVTLAGTGTDGMRVARAIHPTGCGRNGMASGASFRPVPLTMARESSAATRMLRVN